MNIISTIGLCPSLFAKVLFENKIDAITEIYIADSRQDNFLQSFFE